MTIITMLQTTSMIYKFATDSCHATLPTVGQGANMAIEDSLTLVKSVENSPENLERAFAEYYKERQPKTEEIVNLSKRLAGIEMASRYASLNCAISYMMNNNNRTINHKSNCQHRDSCCLFFFLKNKCPDMMLYVCISPLGCFLRDKFLQVTLRSGMMESQLLAAVFKSSSNLSPKTGKVTF